MSSIAMTVGVVVGAWGILWVMFDKYSEMPGWLMGIGLALLLGGAYFS